MKPRKTRTLTPATDDMKLQINVSGDQYNRLHLFAGLIGCTPEDLMVAATFARLDGFNHDWHELLVKVGHELRHYVDEQWAHGDIDDKTWPELCAPSQLWRRAGMKQPAASRERETLDALG